ncbi:Pre-mRNA-splicing factor cwf16 [Knufia obscura]|uniref:Splicing factor YJU2 n=2 Tax=Knufia TaxID=430999 RepID=A0AAN8IJE2_9EURO|nr:Pre-mRNA-splicing factor cwf16 [Knufia obscura]KAK5950092.1 Pre-mRNA-splicing factor cwf16 [Knufia fluminis]
MSERKVLSKYYPPDFDPSAITRTKKPRGEPSKLSTIRLMAPFSMKCTSCGEYIYKGRKFNARKEITEEKYLNISIIRFYIKCTACSSEITFKTDPKNTDYTCERGARRNFEAWRDPASKELQETDEQRLDRLEREEAEAAEEEERNAMEELEQKMEDSKREMQIADALDEIRTRNARIERGEKGGKEEVALQRTRESVVEERRREEEELEEAARAAFRRENVEVVRRQELEEVYGSEKVREDAVPKTHSFEKVARPRKANGGISLVKQAVLASAKPPEPAPKPVVVGGVGLVAYGSDDEDD